MIVMNEREWAERMIADRSLGQKPFETLYRVARYYLDSDIPKQEVRKKLDTFLLQCDPTSSLPKWSDVLDNAVTIAGKRRAVSLQYVEVTKPEMERIDSLKGRQIRRLAFTLLCLAKYWDAVIPGGCGWVNNKDSEIMRMANINTSIRRQSALYHSLFELGMIRFSKKIDNTNVCVMFMEQGETAMCVTDFRNLGYQYLMAHGEPYFVCKNCGIVTKYTNPHEKWKQEYCTACAAEMELRQRAARVRRYYARKNHGTA